jgi:hypothetical protein
MVETIDMSHVCMIGRGYYYEDLMEHNQSLQPTIDSVQLWGKSLDGLQHY